MIRFIKFLTLSLFFIFIRNEVFAVGSVRDLNSAYLTLEQISTPTAPISSNNIIYAKSDDKIYLLDSLGAEIEVGASGSSDSLIYDPNILKIITSFDASIGLSNTSAISPDTFRLTHDAVLVNYAELTIDVPFKFRAVPLSLFLDKITSAASGNFKVIITDETNATTLVDQVIYPQSASLPEVSFIDFSTASNTSSIKIRFETSAEIGSPTSDFADVYIKIGQYVSRKVAYIRDIKTLGTDGGIATAGSWETRTLNNLSGDISIVTSLAANVFTLEAGVYELIAFAPSYKTLSPEIRLYNVTDSSVELEGLTSYQPSAFNMGYNEIKLMGVLSINKQIQFRLEHYCTATTASTGFGFASNFGSREEYTLIKIVKVR